MVAIVMSILLTLSFFRLVQVAVVRRSRVLTLIAGLNGIMAIRPIQGAFAATGLMETGQAIVEGLFLHVVLYMVLMGFLHLFIVLIRGGHRAHVAVFLIYIWTPQDARGAGHDALALEWWGGLAWVALWFGVFVVAYYRHRNYKLTAGGDFLWQEVIREKGWDQPMEPMSAGRMAELRIEVTEWEAKHTPSLPVVAPVSSLTATVPAAPPAVPAIDVTKLQGFVDAFAESFQAEVAVALDKVRAENMATELERLRLALENKRLKAELQRVELERLRLAIDLKEAVKAYEATAKEDFEERQAMVAHLQSKVEEERKGRLKAEFQAANYRQAWQDCEEAAADYRETVEEWANEVKAERRAVAGEARRMAIILGAAFMRQHKLHHPQHPHGLSAEAWLKKWDVRLS